MNRLRSTTYLFTFIFFAGVVLSIHDAQILILRPVSIYLIFIAAQAAFCALHFFRLNILTAMFGAANTFLFLVAVLFEIFARDYTFNWVQAFSVFTLKNRTLALNSILLGLSLFYLIAAWRLPLSKLEWKPLNLLEKATLRRIAWILLALGGGLMFITTPVGTVLETRYAVGQQEGLVNSGGLDLLGMIMLQGVLLAAFVLDGVKSKHTRILFVAALLMLIQFRLLKGDREVLVAFFLMFFFLYMATTRHGFWKRLRVLSIGVTITYFSIIFWGALRNTISTQGAVAAFEVAQGDLLSAQKDDANSGVAFLNRIDLLPQSYWHLLHCIDLYESGTRLDGQSFRDLPAQMLPKPLTDLVGYERPLNDAWLLAKYRLHLGGIYMLATGYWNYGLLGVGIISVIMGFFCSWMERWYRRQPPYLWFFYLGFLGGIVNAIFYGWQPLFKNIQIAVLFAFLCKYAFIFYKQHLAEKWQPKHPVIA